MALKQQIIWEETQILDRYYEKPKREGKIISLTGQALLNGGAERMDRYSHLILTLFEDDFTKIDKLRLTTRFFKP